MKEKMVKENSIYISALYMYTGTLIFDCKNFSHWPLMVVDCSCQFKEVGGIDNHFLLFSFCISFVIFEFVCAVALFNFCISSPGK
jgi:hypothetical protein